MNERSVRNLRGVDPRLVDVVKRAAVLSAVELIVIEGVRSRQRQLEIMRAGKTRTMNSRHLTGHAVDIVPVVNGKVSWDVRDYFPVAAAMVNAARELGVVIRWGGSWKRSTDPDFMRLSKTFVDAVHFEIPLGV